MEDEDRLPRRRDNKVYGSLWLANGRHGGSVPAWMWGAPLFVMGVLAVGCVGLAFLGWGVR